MTAMDPLSTKRMLTRVLMLLLASTAAAAGLPRPVQPPQQQQAVFGSPDKGVGYLSEWSRATKKEFLLDWQAGKESEWTIVMGNEAGDLDSLTAALAWAYHLSHSAAPGRPRTKAIALLQTPRAALALRPENQRALAAAAMTARHEDLLTRDELPEDPETLAAKLRGVVLVDHGAPRRAWRAARVRSVFDHHADTGAAPGAAPRVVERAASCTTLVARQLLAERAAAARRYPLPHALLALVLAAIAVDSGGLRAAAAGGATTPADVAVARRVLRLSRWAPRGLARVMARLDDELRAARKDLGGLGLRDLLRRDWKGDLVDTASARTPTVSLGLASVPYSMEEQIRKTDFQELFHWFAVEAAWTAEVGVDVSVVLSKHKVKTHGKKKKVRQLTLVVRDDVRIDAAQADSLFRTVKKALEENEALDLVPWNRNDELAPRQFVWTERTGASRKVVRPIVEDAVRGWDEVAWDEI